MKQLPYSPHLPSFVSKSFTGSFYLGNLVQVLQNSHSCISTLSAPYFKSSSLGAHIPISFVDLALHAIHLLVSTHENKFSLNHFNNNFTTKSSIVYLFLFLVISVSYNVKSILISSSAK